MFLLLFVLVGCPFRHSDPELLKQKLQVYKVPPSGISQVGAVLSVIGPPAIINYWWRSASYKLQIDFHQRIDKDYPQKKNYFRNGQTVQLTRPPVAANSQSQERSLFSSICNIESDRLKSWWGTAYLKFTVIAASTCASYIKQRTV